ncbi:MAG: RAI1-domain-containing protein [Lentinula lateritia]|uniref:Decapping nuclease n=1 Tax=Lentinula lateritia TaxID=40482 RepID=A0ABQ8VX32_9AGAR|nr:MAG: RAI1-domain-containing protein [Lentinula lateritia]KAJ4500944.1 RAI1 like PD-XK nuclease-domain-containing protein [Lentinula lateritia]
MSKRGTSDVLNETEFAEGGPSKSKPRLNYRTLDSPTASPISGIMKSVQFLPYPNLAFQTVPTKSIPFQQPMPLTSFSYDSQHTQEFSDSALRYYRPPPPNAQLGYGYEHWIRRPEERSRVDSLLKAVDRVTEGQHKKMNLAEVGVVAWRGVVTRLLTAPYEDREGWEMNVMLINGTLYLEEHRTESQIMEKNNIKPQHRKMMYYGYAFESYCTTEHSKPAASNQSDGSSHNSDVSGWGGHVDTNIQWCSVVRTKLGDTKFIIGGEVDCSDGQYKGTTDTFVELKTSMVIRGAADEQKFERKLLKFYFQSFLLGVPKIIVGFRTPSGQLTTTQSFQTMQIPRMLRDKSGHKTNTTPWNPSLCLAWCHQFLTYLKQTVVRDSDDDPSHQKDSVKEEVNRGHSPTSTTVWRVSFVPREGARVVKLDKSEVEEVVNGEDRVGFIPRWYWDKVNSATHISHQSSVRSSSAAVQPAQGAVGGWRI